MNKQNAIDTLLKMGSEKISSQKLQHFSSQPFNTWVKSRDTTRFIKALVARGIFYSKHELVTENFNEYMVHPIIGIRFICHKNPVMEATLYQIIYTCSPL